MQINLIGEILDTIFSLSGKYGRWLNTRKNRWCFVIWIFCCCYWIVRDVQLHLYSQALFCLPSIALHIYGWYYWDKKDKKAEGKMFTQHEVNKLLAAQKRRMKK